MITSKCRHVIRTRVPAVAPRETQTECRICRQPLSDHSKDPDGSIWCGDGRTRAKVFEPAAAPTPVEPETHHVLCRANDGPRGVFGCACADLVNAAESQGVERAQPVDRIMCLAHEWLDEKPCPYCAAQPVEGPRETCKWCKRPIEKDGQFWRHLGESVTPALEYSCDATGDYLEVEPAPVEGVERVTDNRTADTIRSKPYNSADELARSVEELLAENGRAETRIEVLEAALRGLKTAVWKNCGQVRLLKMHDELEAARAALAAPSGEQEKV